MPGELETLRARVHEDHALALRLREIDAEHFASEAAQVAAALGCAVTEGELNQAIAQGRQSWLLRWVL